MRSDSDAFGFFLVFNGHGNNPPSGIGGSSSTAQPYAEWTTDRCILTLEGYAGEKANVGREMFRFLARENGFDLTRISRLQFVASVPHDENNAQSAVQIEDMSSNHTYVNGERVGKGSAPRILRDGDVIGIVTNIENRKKTILGLVLREDRGKLENRKGTPGAARNTGAHLEPMQANSGKAEGRPTPVYNRKRPYGGEEERTSLSRPMGSFSLWNGILRVEGCGDASLYACYAIPTSLHSSYPPPWESWPTTLVLHSRHSMDNQSDRGLMEKFVDATKLACFAFSALHEQNVRLESLADDLAQKKEFFCGSFPGSEEAVTDFKFRKTQDHRSSQQVDFLLTVGSVLSRAHNSALPVSDRGIVGFFSFKDLGGRARTLHSSPRPRISISWASCRFLVRNEDRHELKSLILCAAKSGAIDFPAEKIKPGRYPVQGADVDYVFVPEKADSFTSFSWTVHLRLATSVKFISVSQKAISKLSRMRGPHELLSGTLCKELFRRGGIIFVDGALLVDNLKTNILDRLIKAIVRFHTLVDREDFIVLFRVSELKTLVELGRFSLTAAKAIWEPLQGCIPSDATLLAMQNHPEIRPSSLSQKKHLKRRRPLLHVVEDIFPNPNVLNELFTTQNPTPHGCSFRYVLTLTDTKGADGDSMQSLSTASVSQEPGVGIQKVGIDALELWLEG
eukprot:CAMPEP_0113968270 /NCGR_PEP_ID=MMETSP0011_2-20120614/9428_1 /TAXON_ID=101924 /ORGANISM="Rhodosorus marinus" /LENGTH=678 /DNA_ID=CAMNT_0000981317 /DNA_START=147 /DNA_END=2181 /DNA_ORIENTATION=- /assembly_acc=CAM_ASM_000156